MVPQTILHTSEYAEKGRRNLLQLLEGARGKKNLVIEQGLAGPLGLLVKFSTLQEYGVEKPFFLENENVDSSQRNVVFLARGEKSSQVIAISDQIKRLRRNSQIEHDFYVYWVPRRTLVSDRIFEDAGVLGDIEIGELPLHFIPLAEDVLSLELEGSFRDLFLLKDPTPTFLAAKALMLLQKQHGLFPRILCKGDNAKRLADLLIRMRKEEVVGEESTNTPNSFPNLTPSTNIESAIIIDRSVDFPSVLLTQLTYDGLIDEIFSVSANATEIPTSIIGQAPQANASASASAANVPSQQQLKRKIPLDPTDSLYSTLRDANFAVVGSLLNKVARKLQSSYDKKGIASKTTLELRDFVAKLPGYQAEQASLKTHTAIAEEIIKHTKADLFTRTLEVQQNTVAGGDLSAAHEIIEELISRGASIQTILRLLCLESCVSAGVRSRDFDALRRSILLAYGYQHLLTLSNLEKIGLLYQRGSAFSASRGPSSNIQSTNYTKVRKQLCLIVDEINESEPDDIAYTYSGYAPLSVRLVQCVHQKHKIASLTAGAATAGSGANPLTAAAATTTTTTTTTTTAAALSSSYGFRPFDDAVRAIRGATADISQSGEERAMRARMSLTGQVPKNQQQQQLQQQQKTVLVFYLGGVCRAEISALRFVAKQIKKRIVVCTTNVISGNGMMDAVIEEGSFASS